MTTSSLSATRLHVERGSQSQGEHGYWHVAQSISLSELGAQLETGRPRVAQSEIGWELIAALSAFEIDYTPSGNLTVDVRAGDHDGEIPVRPPEPRRHPAPCPR
jgi:hypothetical protein